MEQQPAQRNRIYYRVWSAAILMLATAAGFAWMHLGMPSDGARLKPGSLSILPQGVVVEALVEGEDRLQTGDIVTAVDGTSVVSWADLLLAPGEDRPGWQIGEGVRYDLIRDGQPLQKMITLVPYPLANVVRRSWGSLLFALVYQLLATLVFFRRRDSLPAAALFLSASGFLSSMTWALGLQVSDFISGLGFWLYKATSVGAYMLFWISGLHFALTFPRPHPLHSRYPKLIPLMYIVPYGLQLANFGFLWAAMPNGLAWASRLTFGESVHAAIFLTLTLITVVWQYQLNSSGAFRQQMRWVLLGGMISGGAGLLLYILPRVLWGVSIDSNLMGVILLPFPASLAIAVTRHNLLDIDVLINRALVYGVLSGITMGIYVLLVGLTADLLQIGDRSFIAFLATGVVAVLFQPVRQRLQRAVNQLMYGDRDDPYVVLSQLGQRLEATAVPEAVLPALVRGVAEALRLPYVAISIGSDGARLDVAAEYGKPVAEPLRLPLIYQSEPLGELMVGARGLGDGFGHDELALLESIARQAGPAVYGVKLTADLRRSRQQLVTAREEERRRLRRDLHDGLGPTLAANLLKIGLMRGMVERDSGTALQILEQIENDIDSTLSEVRRLVYELRPPELDQLGLVGAVAACAERYAPLSREIGADGNGGGMRIRVDAPPVLPLLPAAVEVASYRIVQEGVNNAARHAQAAECVIRLQLVGDSEEAGRLLRLQICDDGVGIDGRVPAGVGFASMRERAEEVGGRFSVESALGKGTCLTAVMPLMFESQGHKPERRI